MSFKLSENVKKPVCISVVVFFSKGTGLIRHRELDKCVDIGTDHKLHLKSCDSKSSTLKWNFKEVFPWKRS